MRKGGVVLNLWLSSSSKTAWILDEQKITKNGDQSTSLSSNKKVSPVVHTHTHTHTHTHSRILLSHEEEWKNAIYSNKDGPRDYHRLSEVNQRQISFSITYM